MTFEHATILFDAMDAERKASVLRIFDLTRSSPAFSDWRDALAQAVDDVADEIEREMLLEQETVGMA
jgi:hypothetical protein